MKAAPLKTRADFDLAFRRLQDAVSVGIVGPRFGLVSEQTRLLLKAVHKVTPYRSQAEGKKAIARDFDRFAVVYREQDFSDKRLKRLIAARDYAGFEQFLENLPPASRMRGRKPGNRFDLGAYKRARVNGSYRGRARVYSLGEVHPSITKGMQRLQKNIGRTRGGWNAAARALRVAFPGWVEKHGTAFGGIQVRDGGEWIRTSNRTKWGATKRAQHIVDLAVAARAGAMQTFLKKQMQLAAKKAGF